jgi:hypothetical protein
MHKKILIILSLLFIAGCAIRKNLVTPFAVPVNKPIRDGDGDPTHGTTYCPPGADGKFDPAAILSNTGMDPAGDGAVSTDGGGCVMRPIQEVWAALNNLEQIKFQDMNSFEATRQINPTPAFTHLYVITYHTSTPIGEQTWTLDWYHGFDQGTFEAPERVNIIYGRTGGSSTISAWSGQITLTKVNSQITSMAMHNRFKSLQGSDKDKGSSSDTVSEMIRHARTVPPDYKRLLDGLTNVPAPVPTPPDSKPPPGPVPGASYCVKDATGKYPAPSQVTTDTENGASVIHIKSCVTAPAATLFNASKNHTVIYWKNANRASAGASGNVLIVNYEKDAWFGLKKIRWSQDWMYQESPRGAPYQVKWAMDPVTSDFPAWSGALGLVAVEPSLTEVSIDNTLLLESVSESATTNRTVSLDLLNDIAGHRAQDFSDTSDLLPDIVDEPAQ